MSALTRRQSELLAFIRAFRAGHGVSPSYGEMRSAIGIASNAGVARLVDGLISRGALRRMERMARAIEPVDDTPDLLAFMDVETREQIVRLAAFQSKVPELLIAEICRKHFGRGRPPHHKLQNRRGE